MPKIYSNVSLLFYLSGFSGCEWIIPDKEHFKNLTGADSLMIARKAAANASIFFKNFQPNVDKIVKQYLEYVTEFLATPLIFRQNNTTQF